jgi:two-component system chemotaxis response regulator CheY
MAKILIIDDALFTRKVLSDILTKEGHTVVGEAQNAKEGIALYKKLRPNVVTLDIVMPETEGIDALQAIREIKAIDENAQIVVISAVGQRELVTESMQAGARDFIVKPFEPIQVINAVRNLVAH